MFHRCCNGTQTLARMMAVTVLIMGSMAAVGQARVIEEVFVSAQKKTQSLQDVPISVSTFDSEFINDLATTDIGELMQYTPNVKFSDAQGHSPVLTIRGFGTPPLGRGLEPSVGLVIDDVFYGRSTYINDTNFDLQRVEVLRGPQGTLFGKNTIAGVFSFNTTDPDFDHTAYINLGLADHNEKRAEAAGSLTLIPEKLAMRVAARVRNRDGHVYNTARDEQNRVEDFGARVKLKWIIDDQSDFLFNAWMSEHSELGLITQLKIASEQSLNEFAEKDPEVEADAFNDTLSADNDTFSDRDTKSASIKYTRDFGEVGISDGLNMTLIAGYSEYTAPYAIDGDFSPIDYIIFGTDDPNTYAQNVLELRFGGSLPGLFGVGNGIDFIAGVFGSTSRFSTSITQTNGAGFVSFVAAGGVYNPSDDFGFLEGPLSTPVGAPDVEGEGEGGAFEPETLFAKTDVDTESVAYFMQYDWYVTDAVTTVLGLRYGEDKRIGNLSSGRRGLPGAGPLVTGQVNFDKEIEEGDYDFTPKLTVTWEATEDIRLYATATEGFKSGGFAAGVFSDDKLTFDPETAESYEIGFKSKLLGGSLTLNGAYFYTTYSDLQVRNFDGTKIFVTNAADATTQGLELDFFWLPPIPYVSIGGSAGFVDATYDTYLCAVPVTGTGSGEGDPSCYNEDTGPQDDPQAPSFQDLSGQPLAYAPEISGSLYGSLNMPISDTGVMLLVGVDALYQGDHFVDTDNDPNAMQEATTKFNARVGLKGEDGSWSLILNGKNLTEEKESVLTIDQPQISGNYISAALPDEAFYSLDFRYNFNAQ